MNRLTAQERQRVFTTRQRADADVLARLAAPIAVSTPSRPPRRGGQFLTTAVILALLATGWYVGQRVEFHPPASIADVLPPR